MSKIERVEWDDFLARFAWRQGEHVAMIGPTGAGKTTLALAILELRSYVIAFGTKPPRDATLNKWSRRPGWRTISKADDLPRVHGRSSLYVLLWVKFKSELDEARQRYQLYTAMWNAFRAGGWTLYCDEISVMENDLRLKTTIRQMITQGRSEGITMVGGTQRPAFIQRYWYDQPTHLFFARDNDHDNLRRISGMNGVNSRLIRETVASLRKHEWLYIHTRDGYMFITTPPQA